ncbi:uncharacterized protein B0I36DRAFT_244149 [Microdochium trichocladiopsis]|uniref:Rhodopsin domain-containing protein n=1 Tax=Microdochium trichocladiopsis TaxID=1682393 RepID=A0A9P8Y3D7_9PEZI|nr:uncharacterized protein B0I36DRAFT_244149 [Microdochium trichocladiopsis]KAH7028951.1 hypothetical protein B0I36DRAFT_244149 [Microdochium trichocladiopsis]
MDPSTPLAPAPEGVVPDFHSITPLQIELAVVFCVTFGIATILLLLRLYTGFHLTKQLGWDALLIVLSWMASLAFFVIMVVAFPVGWGRNNYNVTMGQFQEYLNLLQGLTFTYIWPPTLAKLSLLIMYYRIDPAMGFRYCAYLAALVVLAPTIVYTVLFAGPCNPTTGDLQCLNGIVVAQATTNIVSDVVLIAMPLQMTIQLNMPRRQKITLGCLMTFGSFVVIFSIIRTAFIHTFTTNPDVTYTQAYVAVWPCLELNFGIICNCLAMLQPFLRAHMPRLADKIMGTGGSVDSPHGDGGGGGRHHHHNNKERGMMGDENLVTIGKLSARRPWLRGDRGTHSYVLHSIDKSNMRSSLEEAGGGDNGAAAAADGSRGPIRVTDEVRVEISRTKGDKEDTASERRMMDDSS